MQYTVYWVRNYLHILLLENHRQLLDAQKDMESKLHDPELEPGEAEVSLQDLRRWAYALYQDAVLAQVLATEHRGLINSIWFTADGRRLASVSKQTDSAVLFLDPHTGATVARFRPHALCGASVRTSGDGRILVSSAADGSVRIWVTPDLLSEAKQR